VDHGTGVRRIHGARIGRRDGLTDVSTYFFSKSFSGLDLCFLLFVFVLFFYLLHGSCVHLESIRLSIMRSHLIY
jgi:hypothetical protein